MESNGRRDVFGKPTSPNTVNTDAFEASAPTPPLPPCKTRQARRFRLQSPRSTVNIDVVGMCAARVNSTLLPLTRTPGRGCKMLSFYTASHVHSLQMLAVPREEPKHALANIAKEFSLHSQQPPTQTLLPIASSTPKEFQGKHCVKQGLLLKHRNKVSTFRLLFSGFI